jgi:hypothetical protein
MCAAVMAAALSGCASTYEATPVSAPSAKLTVGGSVLIATSANGYYADEQYPNSGAATSSALQTAFEKYSNAVSVSSECGDFACLKQKQAATIYVVPRILGWVDRATEWSGKKDVIEIKITIYDQAGQALSSSVVTGKSKWATFGGDHPQDLLPALMDGYVKSLY